MTRERCKSCGQFNPVPFEVPDHVWQTATPPEFVDGPLCILCFDYFACEAGIEWDDCIRFTPVSGARHRRLHRALDHQLALDTLDRPPWLEPADA